jgi:acetyl-CoA decarbonylase/synthase complex subunit gamma
MGGVLVRLGFGRMSYAVRPGLYAVGEPGPESPVLVSANYKLSFDSLRRELSGVDAWILVIDTKGINVWCAAGKGTFGTEEILARVSAAGLADTVSRRELILPQLGASGVAAHEVEARSGFRVIYGPVRAADIGAFLAAGGKCTPEMRRVRFGLRARAAVVPLEVLHWGKWFLLLAAVILGLAGLGPDGYSVEKLGTEGSRAALLLLSGFLGGTVAAPLLLPWLPVRAFSLKGVLVGAVVVGGAAAAGLLQWTTTGDLLELVAWCLLVPALSAFLALNYTGSSTFTGLSGVKRETRLAVPLEAAAGVLKLDAEGCIGCRRCTEVCPHAVFAVENGRARVAEPDACMECGACARNCPVGVISVNAGVGCATGLILGGLSDAKPGCDCSKGSSCT